MWVKVVNHWFLIAIAMCFTVGYMCADWMRPIADVPHLRDSVVFTVMWAMGVTLHADTVKASLARPLPGLLAIGINIFAVPLLTLPTMWILPSNIFGGLFVASLVPCTLASASVWTRRAGGDDSVAMMTTVATNLACIGVIPLGLALVLSQQTEISAGEQIGKLAVLVVAPLILAHTMRRIGCGVWADRNKPKLAMIGQLGILVMVVFGAMASSDTIHRGGEDAKIGWHSLGMLLLCATTIHVIAFAIGVFASKAMGVTRQRQIAVGISGSQKTLMVGLQIAIDCGVSVVPMLVYHLGQLVIDTVIADLWKAGRWKKGR